jgi:hypothetical protein
MREWATSNFAKVCGRKPVNTVEWHSTPAKKKWKGIESGAPGRANREYREISGIFRLSIEIV